ncbi:MAG: hypothetical protein ACC608_12300 [Anaerofustis sp.]
MKLYALKSGNEYLKTSGANPELVSLSHASVFPSLTQANESLQRMIQKNITPLRIVMLEIIETELSE